MTLLHLYLRVGLQEVDNEMVKIGGHLVFVLVVPVSIGFAEPGSGWLVNIKQVSVGVPGELVAGWHGVLLAKVAWTVLDQKRELRGTSWAAG